MHIFARGGGKFEVLYCKYERLVQRRLQFWCVSWHMWLCMYLLEGVASLKCYTVSMNVLFREGCNFDVLVDTCDYACICQSGGKFEVLYCKYERLVQRRLQFWCVSWHMWLCMYLLEGVASLKCYTVSMNVLFREGCNFDVLVDTCDYACICQRGWQVWSAIL